MKNKQPFVVERVERVEKESYFHLSIKFPELKCEGCGGINLQEVHCDPALPLYCIDQIEDAEQSILESYTNIWSCMDCKATMDINVDPRINVEDEC